MTEKRYVSDVKNTEKEVRIFDLEDEKKIFNIFFNELDSAICLNGALGDIITRLNEQHELIEYLKPLANENTHYIADMEDDIATFKEEIKELTDALNQRTQQLDDYGLKVQETLQEAYNQNSRHNTPISTGVCVMLINICKELGVEL